MYWNLAALQTSGVYSGYPQFESAVLYSGINDAVLYNQTSYIVGLRLLTSTNDTTGSSYLKIGFNPAPLNFNEPWRSVQSVGQSVELHGDIRSVAVYSGELHFIGSFTITVTGAAQPLVNYAVFNLSRSMWVRVALPSSMPAVPTPTALAADNQGTLWMAVGDGTNVALLSYNGTWTLLPAAPGLGTILAFAFTQDGSRVYVGGRFDFMIGGVHALCVAFVDVATRQWDRLNIAAVDYPSAGIIQLTYVLALTLTHNDSRLHVGGRFEQPVRISFESVRVV